MLLAAAGDKRALAVLHAAGASGGGAAEKLAYADALARCRAVEDAKAAYAEYWAAVNDVPGIEEEDIIAELLPTLPESKTTPKFAGTGHVLNSGGGGGGSSDALSPEQLRAARLSRFSAF